jgi:hypothetical protein
MEHDLNAHSGQMRSSQCVHRPRSAQGDIMLNLYLENSHARVLESSTPL